MLSWNAITQSALLTSIWRCSPSAQPPRARHWNGAVAARRRAPKQEVTAAKNPTMRFRVKKETLMKQMIVLAVSIATITTLLADERSFARALQRWQHDRSPSELLHIATSGLFLTEDLATLR
jgi:hypothetical protein